MSEYYVGIDIGGTNTKIGILDSDFNILKEVKIKTLSQNGPHDTFARIWNNALIVAKELGIEEESIKGIGMGIPGPVVDNSIVKIAANFSWGNDFNAKKLMEEVSGKKVQVENDVRNIALGEYKFGAARGYNNAIVIPIGTGISAGMIINGKILSGVDGCAGEFGHIVIDENGYKCGCGLTGCLETYVSAPGIVREAKRILKEKKYGLLYEYSINNEIEAHDIFSYYLQGDDIAIEIVDNFSKKLAYGISMLLNILNTEAIILAGGVSKSADIIIPLVKKYLPQYALKITMQNIDIKKCELLDSAGIKGAAAMIKEL